MYGVWFTLWYNGKNEKMGYSVESEKQAKRLTHLLTLFGFTNVYYSLDRKENTVCVLL